MPSPLDHYEFPSDLFTSPEIKAQLTPLRECIKTRWEPLLEMAQTSPDQEVMRRFYESRETCQLCAWNGRNAAPEDYHNCGGCVICKTTGSPHCYETPYVEFDRCLSQDRDTQKAIQAELDFLRAIETELTKEP